MTPTQRTLKELRKKGYICDMVERFISIPGKFGVRRDFLNIIDIIAIAENETMGVQSCGQSFSEHDKKILDSENSVLWIKAGNILQLWGWRKVKVKRGVKQMIWQPRVKTYSLEDF